MHISSIIPSDIVCVQSEILKFDSYLIELGKIDELYQSEIELIKGYPQKRQNEFLTGRICSRRALEIFEISDFPILYNENKLPLFPSDIVGSISHTSKYCIVAIGSSKNYLSIGVDIERLSRMQSEYFDTICTNDELLFLKTYSNNEQIEKATIFFAAKEAFYKMQFKLTSTVLNFKDITCSIVDSNTFSATLNKDINNYFLINKTYHGRYAIENGMVYSVIFIYNNY